MYIATQQPFDVLQENKKMWHIFHDIFDYFILHYIIYTPLNDPINDGNDKNLWKCITHEILIILSI